MAPNAPEAIALGFSDDVLPALLKSPSRSRGLRRALSDRQNAGVMVDEEDIYDPEAAPTVVDLEETPHDTSVTLENRPQVARVPTPVALERLVGLGGTREEASVAGRPSTSETDRAARTSEGAGIHTEAEQYLDVEMYLRGEDILATRGQKTDSFVRVILIEENLTEHKIGQTEVQHDTLDPEFRQPVQLRFRLHDTKHRIRCELCDPGDEGADTQSGATVLGAVELTLEELRRMVGILLEGEERTLYRRGSDVGGKVGVSKLELAPLSLLQGQRARAERENRAGSPVSGGGRNSRSSSTATPAAKQAASGLGRIVLVPEIISSEREFCWLVIGANGLRTENLSLPPSPFIKIFRILADETKAPVYESGHVRNVRDCAWKTVPIPLQRLRNGAPLRVLEIQVWDWSDVGNNRMFGYARLPASQLLAGAETTGAWAADGAVGIHSHRARGMNIPLVRPSLKERRGSMVSTIIGLGGAAKPGSLTVLRAEIDSDEASATRIFKAFDVEGVRREAHHLLPPTFVRLSERYADMVEERQLGLSVADTSCCFCFSGCARTTRRLEEYFEASSWAHWALQHNPFHYAYLNIGSRFGSGIQALFGFANTLIKLNLVLAVLWFLLVNMPQLLLNDQATEVVNDLKVTFLNDEIPAEERPRLLYFGGYEPKYYDDDGESVVYHMDVAYLMTAILGTFGVSLFWLVRSISRQYKQRAATAHGAEAVKDIVNLVFNGWDMLETTRRSTNTMREHIAVFLKQQLLQLNLVAHKKQAKSKAVLRDLFFKRLFYVTLSGLTLILSLITVVLVLQPNNRQWIVDRSSDLVGETVAELLPSIIISTVNMVAPVLIKVFVRLEKWSNPETELRQAIIRIFAIKMLNLAFTAVQLENPNDLLGGDSDPDNYMEGCQEAEAGKTYVQLVLADLVLVGLTTTVPKWLMFRLLKWKMIIDLPKEVMELIYRQALLWVGALYTPLLYPIGVVAHALVFFTKYVAFRYLYKAPEKPFSRSSVTSLFLFASMASLLAMVIPFGYALSQTTNTFCGPLRREECAKLPYNESGACAETRYNHDALYDALMSGEQVDFFNTTLYGSDFIAQITSCSASCWAATIIETVFSAPVLIVVGLLTCIALNFTRAKLRSTALELRRAEQLLAEEHHDKIKLLRFNGVQL